MHVSIHIFICIDVYVHKCACKTARFEECLVVRGTAVVFYAPTIDLAVHNTYVHFLGL